MRKNKVNMYYSKVGITNIMDYKKLYHKNTPTLRQVITFFLITAGRNHTFSPLPSLGTTFQFVLLIFFNSGPLNI